MMCSKCGSSSRNNDGKCVPCYNAYMKGYLAKRYQARRDAAIVTLGGECISCGGISDLQFDHQDRGLKSFSMAKIWLGKQDRLQAELAKCQLLCSACHLIKTVDERSVPHGGGKKGRRNCKCDPCRERNRQYMRDFRATVGARGRAVGSSASS